jgi:hypothetical protein
VYPAGHGSQWRAPTAFVIPVPVPVHTTMVAPLSRVLLPAPILVQNTAPGSVAA